MKSMRVTWKSSLLHPGTVTVERSNGEIITIAGVSKAHYRMLKYSTKPEFTLKQMLDMAGIR